MELFSLEYLLLFLDDHPMMVAHVSAHLEVLSCSTPAKSSICFAWSKMKGHLPHSHMSTHRRITKRFSLSTDLSKCGAL
eukprot:262120-Amphidinium_carterae.1